MALDCWKIFLCGTEFILFQFAVLDYWFGKLKHYIILLHICWNIKMSGDIVSLFQKYASKKLQASHEVVAVTYVLFILIAFGNLYTDVATCYIYSG